MKPGSLKEMHNAYIIQLDEVTEFKNIGSWPHNTMFLEQVAFTLLRRLGGLREDVEVLLYYMYASNVRCGGY